MRGNVMTTPPNDVDDDVIPEFDFNRAIPSPFIGRIGPNYTIWSHGDASDRQAFMVVSTHREGGGWIDFVDLEIPSCPAPESGAEWIAREDDRSLPRDRRVRLRPDHRGTRRRFAVSDAADVHYTIWHLDTGNLIGGLPDRGCRTRGRPR